MKILVTGAKGFVGKNLCAQLKNIRDGKARNYGFGPADPAAAGAGITAGKGQAFACPKCLFPDRNLFRIVVFLYRM